MPKPGDSLVIEPAAVAALLGSLRDRGHTPIGPTVRDGAIVLAEIEDASQLPAGWGDEQDGGRYRLRRREDGALFAHAASPHSWKRWLHPPTVVRWRARRDDAGFVAEPEKVEPPRYAFVGVKPCELAAILVQDRVFLGGPFVDPAYRARREGVFVVAVQCGVPSASCFCASMGTGPAVGTGFDLALTELLDDGRHELLLAVGSERGAAVAAELPHRPADADDVERGNAALARARASVARAIETDGLKDALYRRYEDPHWDEVGRRCLGCANCTMVCPTCFCATVEDVTDLAGAQTERRRVWDSCFSQEFSYVHGGSVRTSAGARYRQWITHKLATWHDQFGTSGCVGCGRCITWCPVGIDITAEARAVRPAAAEGGRP